MRNIKQEIAWLRELEKRKWKRFVNFIEICLYSIVGFANVVTVKLSGDGTVFQSAFLFFTSCLALSIGCIAPTMLSTCGLVRWKIRVIKLAFLSATGLAALSGFLIIKVQNGIS